MSRNSFFLKNPLTCPICEQEFQRETMRSGQGRLISLLLRPDLRRIYKFSEKYGEIFPLIYNVTVCPHCYFATLSEDFTKKDLFNFENARENTEKRKENAQMLFGEKTIDFTQNRDLYHGYLSFYLAANCYNFCTSEGYSNAKKALCFLRGAWCCSDIHEKGENKEYDRLGIHFRYQAFECYSQAIKLMYQAKSRFGDISHYGPDLDTNYGYNGFIYVYCYHLMYFLDLVPTPVLQYKQLHHAQIYLSKVFGFGKSSRDKPTPLLETARDLYSTIHERLDILKNDDKIKEDLEQMKKEVEQMEI